MGVTRRGVTMRAQSSFVELEKELGKRVSARIEKQEEAIDKVREKGPEWCRRRKWHSPLKLNRIVSLTAHEDHLAVSWKRTQADWTCIKFNKDVDAAQRAMPDEQALSSAGKAVFLLRHRDEFGSLGDKAKEQNFNVERYVFYKTSPAVPAGLSEMAPDCAELYRKAPLHHYFVIGRCEYPNNGPRPNMFSAWSVIGTPFAKMSELLSHLEQEIRPKLVPELFYVDRWSRLCVFLKIFIGVIIVVAIAAPLVGWLCPDWRDRFYNWAGLATNAQIEDVRLELNSTRSEFDERISALEAGGNSVNLEAEIGRLSGVIEELAVERDRSIPASNLSVQACLPVDREGGRFVPTYLYVATALPDGTLNLASLAGGLDASATLGFEQPTEIIRGNLTIPQFESIVSPVSDEARSRNCRHFVLLMENDPEDASRYIAQRDAVERHFYIYRPR
jgi:hypothetical protein